MKKIKIAFIIDHLDVGGTETQLYLLLKNMNRDRFDPIVLCLKEKGLVGYQIEKLDIKVLLLDIDYRFTPKVINRMIMVLSLARYLKKMKIQVIQSFLITANIFGTIAGRLAGIKVICASERSIKNTDNQDLSSRNFVFRLLSPIIDRVSGNSEMVIDYLVEKVGIPENKTVCIYNGIQTEAIISDKPSLRKQLGLNTDTMLIGIVGRLVQQKNHSLLFDAALKVREKYTNFKILIIGDGPVRRDLEIKIKKMNLEDSVLFLGNRSDVPTLLPNLDIVVQTSNFEGLPNVIMEAMAAALPVVATNAGGTKELVIHRETGFLINIGDKNQLARRILELVKDPQRMKEMGKSGQYYIRKHFSIEQLVQKTQNLYLELLEQKNKT